MEYVECATFHLNSGDISISILGTAVSNQFGTINGNRNDMTWSNVNFRTILGDMYDKYDKFNIKLALVCHNNTTVLNAGDAKQLMVKINMAGLQFSNATYKTGLNSNNNVCVMGAFYMTNTPSGQYFYDDNVFTISKPDANTNVRLYLTNVEDAVPNWTSVGPTIDFYFRVYGVKKQ